MHRYAQTNLQLQSQLRGSGYSDEDQEYLAGAYRLAAGTPSAASIGGRVKPSSLIWWGHQHPSRSSGTAACGRSRTAACSIRAG